MGKKLYFKIRKICDIDITIFIKINTWEIFFFNISN